MKHCLLDSGNKQDSGLKNKKGVVMHTRVDEKTWGLMGFPGSQGFGVSLVEDKECAHLYLRHYIENVPAAWVKL